MCGHERIVKYKARASVFFDMMPLQGGLKAFLLSLFYCAPSGRGDGLKKSGHALKGHNNLKNAHRSQNARPERAPYHNEKPIEVIRPRPERAQ